MNEMQDEIKWGNSDSEEDEVRKKRRLGSDFELIINSTIEKTIAKLTKIKLSGTGFSCA